MIGKLTIDLLKKTILLFVTVLSYIFPSKRNKVLFVDNYRNTLFLYLYIKYRYKNMLDKIELFYPLICENKINCILKYLKSMIIKPHITVTDSTISDSLLNPISTKSKIINLGHGMGVKIGGRSKKYKNPILKIIYPLMNFDYIVSPNKWRIEKFYKHTLNLDHEKHILANLPRNMLFIDKEFYDFCLNELRKMRVFSETFSYLNTISKLKNNGYKIIFVIPTWRNDKELYREFLANLFDLLNSINNKYDDIVMVLKLHPHPISEKFLEDVLKMSSERLIILSKDSILYLLLPLADVLITDYSSVATDFAILDKPIIFFCPDINKIGKLYLYALPGKICYTRDECIKVLSDYLTNPYKDKNLRKKTTQVYFETLEIDNIIKTMLELLK